MLCLRCDLFSNFKNDQKENRQTKLIFFIPNFRHVLNVVCFLLGDSPASEFYMPTFRPDPKQIVETAFTQA